MAADRRVLKDRTYLSVASLVAQLGTCLRLQVGAVLISSEGRVVGTGYNGAGPGMPHCHPDTCGPAKRCLRCEHAETNALAHRSGDPYTAYVTHEPCINCARALILAGVRRVIFFHLYTSMSEDERAARQEWLDTHKVEWIHMQSPWVVVPPPTN